ncbi:MAG TPA: MBL fold metallo-hydrolase [Candidatus Thermoplasmatota archaeon]|nr:MBL fold metallo-hydrolase [Candidatus Thermoplasmatota archaeon]
MQPQIEVIPLGGHSDFGRNMTAVRVGRDIVIFDMGVKLDPLQDLPEGEGVDTLSAAELTAIGAIPDDAPLSAVDGNVVAIVVSHAHADHVGAVQVLAGRYPKAPIYGSPYTIAFVEDQCTPRDRRLASEGRLTIPNRLVALGPKDRARLGRGAIELELVHVTHSIPGTTMPVLHTAAGAIVYALDFKLDDTPILGKGPDYARLAQIGREGVHVLITEATNAERDEKTDSEKVARTRLRDLLLGVDHDDEAIFVSTFSSHAARLASIFDQADALDRDVLLLGRSLDRYTGVAARTGHLDVPGFVETAPSRRHADDALRRVADDPTRFVVVLTGHQGEPGAMLTRIAAGETTYNLTDRDDVVFASNVIPTDTCTAQRADLEARLRRAHARVFKGAHASGHASAIDHRELLVLLQPEHIVPAHGGLAIQNAYAELAAAEGWRLRERVHVLANGERHVVGAAPSPGPRRHEEIPRAAAVRRRAPRVRAR